MSVAHSTATSIGTLPATNSGSLALSTTGKPAATKRFVGSPVRLPPKLASIGSAWQFLQLASPDIGNTVSTEARALPPPERGLDPHQRIGILTPGVVVSRERGTRSLEPVDIVGDVAKREAGEEWLVAYMLMRSPEDR